MDPKQLLELQPKERRALGWADGTVWGTVNAVNLLQAAGFTARIVSGSLTINHFLGYFMFMLAIPASLAWYALLRAQAGWRRWLGLSVHLALMLGVDYLWPVEFRSPQRAEIFAPYRCYFSGHSC